MVTSGELRSVEEGGIETENKQIHTPLRINNNIENVPQLLIIKQEWASQPLVLPLGGLGGVSLVLVLQYDFLNEGILGCSVIQSGPSDIF